MGVEDRLVLPGDEIQLDSLLIRNNKSSLIMIAHGYVGVADGMRPLAEYLSQTHDVLFYALRGHRFHYGILGKHGGSPGIFKLRDAIQDQVKLTDELAQRYDSIGYLGFSVGATIAAYAAQHPKVKAMYLASPYLSSKDIRIVGWLLEKLSFIGKGPFSLGDPALQDAQRPSVPVKVAIARQDNVLKSNERVDEFNAKFGADNVITINGNHCFNVSSLKYLGKDDDGRINNALFANAKDFFDLHMSRKYLSKP